MFLITDKTRQRHSITPCNDLATLKDIIIGITGSEQKADMAYDIACRMSLNEKFSSQAYDISCVSDDAVYGLLNPTAYQNEPYILFNIMRLRASASENQSWFTCLYLGVGEASEEEQRQLSNSDDSCIGRLHKVIEAYLATEKGWKENCRASLDYNWGDFVMSLPLPKKFHVYENPPAGQCLRIVDMTVNQDELLASMNYKTKLLCINKDGYEYPLMDCVVDFQCGELVNAHIPEDCSVARILLPNHETIRCDPDNAFQTLLQV